MQTNPSEVWSSFFERKVQVRTIKSASVIYLSWLWGDRQLYSSSDFWRSSPGRVHTPTHAPGPIWQPKLRVSKWLERDCATHAMYLPNFSYSTTILHHRKFFLFPVGDQWFLLLACVVTLFYSYLKWHMEESVHRTCVTGNVDEASCDAR